MNDEIERLLIGDLDPRIEQMITELNVAFPGYTLKITPVLVDEEFKPMRKFIAFAPKGEELTKAVSSNKFQYVPLKTTLDLEQFQDEFVDQDSLLRAIKEALRLEMQQLP